MPRKGKKKLSALEAEASKTSKEQPEEKKPQQQAPPPQRPQPPQPSQSSQPSQPSQQPQQPQGAWAQRQQQQQQQQQISPHQQPEVQSFPPQQQGSCSQPIQQQSVTQGPPPQQQGSWSQSAARGPPLQQQRSWSQSAARGPPSQQQGSWSQPAARGPSSQQQRLPWSQLAQQQSAARAPPSQQSRAQGILPPQQGGQSHPQGAWGQPAVQGPPPQQIRGQGQGQSLQQQGARSQQVPMDIHAAGDSKLVTGKDSMKHSDTQQQQATTSVQSQLSQLSLKDPFNTTKTSKVKLSSEALKQYQLSMPKRQNPMKAGTRGKHISVYTNMFEIIFSPNFITNAVHYDVSITPTASKTLYRQIFEQCRMQNFSNRYPAFDGKKNAYSANDLPFANLIQTDIVLRFNDGDTERSKTFTIILKKVGNIDLSWIKHLKPGLDETDRDQTGIQVLDIIMRHAPESRFLSVGRSLYWSINNQEPLGGGLSLSRGGFQSAVLGWKPYINIDVAHKGFPTSQNVVHLMAELTRASNSIPDPNEVNKRWNREKIEKFLRGLKVTYQLPERTASKRTYRINGLGPSAYEHRFNCDNVMFSIADYFMQKKSYRLHHPKLPCLWVGATNRSDKIYLPAELCVIMTAQPVNRKLDDEQTTNMIRYAATSAPTRKQRIEEAFKMINVNNSPTMSQEFHLSVRPEMKQVGARILPPPDLQYCMDRKARVSKGIWQMQAFQKASSLEKGKWTILDLSDTRVADFIHEFVKSLISCAKELGMRIEEPLTPYKSLRSQNISEITEYFNSKIDMKLILVIISDRTDTTYGKVKQITELGVGILTQCIKFRTLKKNSYSAVKNILLKINSKLNGINHTLHATTMPQILKNNDCIIVGADVTHPSPDAINIPSIAAVAASSNHSAFQYNIALRLQQPKEEMILDIEDIIISQLRIYETITKRLPNKIIYYRDGVSEGQLAQVMHFEINAIKRACARVQNSNIQITCLVVQKRHHVRLFPTSEADSDDRNKNVRAGTIVDTEITHPNHIDFYLVSHASIQGTARPTKYRCICNESNYTEDDIEELTYYLCHMYARCTRAVSYPAPTYYAHLGAYRGRALIQGVNIRLNNLEAEQNKLNMKISKNSPMCFV